MRSAAVQNGQFTLAILLANPFFSSIVGIYPPVESCHRLGKTGLGESVSVFAIVVWPDSHYCSGMKPNYQYEKRQRELEKKKKKAEKEHKKAVPTETPPEPETVIPQDTTQDKP